MTERQGLKSFLVGAEREKGRQEMLSLRRKMRSAHVLIFVAGALLGLGVGCGEEYSGDSLRNSNADVASGLSLQPIHIVATGFENDVSGLALINDQDALGSVSISMDRNQRTRIEIPGLSFTITPAGEIVFDDLDPNQDLANLEANIERIQLALYNSLAVAEGVMVSSVEQVPAELSDEVAEDYLSEGGMVYQLLEASSDVPFAQWWGEEGLSFLKNLGIGLAAGATIMITWHFIAEALAAKAAELSSVTYLADNAQVGAARWATRLADYATEVRGILNGSIEDLGFKYHGMRYLQAEKLSEMREFFGFLQMWRDELAFHLAEAESLSQSLGTLKAVVSSLHLGAAYFGLFGLSDGFQSCDLFSCDSEGCAYTENMAPLFEIMM